MKKVLLFILLGFMPLAANAANLCFQDDFGYMYKFKKPSVPKMGAATIAGVFVAPTQATGFDNTQFGVLSGNAVASGDGSIFYQINASDMYGDYFAFFQIIYADKKGFSGAVWDSYVKEYSYSDNQYHEYSGLNFSSIPCWMVPFYY